MDLYNYFEGKKVLITGNTGFKGSWLTMWLLKMNADVYGISDTIITDPSLFRVLDLESKITHQYLDIRDYSDLEKAIVEIKPDFIFHLAAQAIVSKSYSDPLSTLTTNAIGTANILEVLRKMDHDCVAVLITSDKCYENIEQVWGYREIDQLGGKDIYSCSKGAAELIIHAYFHSFIKDTKPNIRIASARAGNVLGGGDFSFDRIIPDCMRAWGKNEKVLIRSPYATRPWQHVLEPLSGYLWLGAKLSVDNSFNGQSFNFGPKADQDRTVLDLIDNLSKYWHFEKTEDAYEYARLDNLKEAGLLKLNCDKAMFYLDWQANLNYHHTIRFISEWYSKFYHQSTDICQYTLDQIAEYEEVASANNLVWANN